MAAPDTVKKLVDDFERLKGGPVPESFDEAQLRVSYINPFWEALGWNVRDHREVVVEKVVAMRHSTKRADYCFLLNGRPAFVLETKDFRKHLDDPDVVFQLNRYGYNIPVDFGFLTNFAELQLYETWKPPLIENPVKNRVKKFHFEYPEYVERWDDLEAALAREAVAAGALNKFLTKKEPTRNKEAVDRKFFERLNDWRAELARDVALRNPDLSVHDINEAVQRLLDRCVFMRVIEDRGIEATELLLDALNRWKVEREKKLYRYVVDKFRYLDPQYNGELFDKHFSEQLLIDDKPLKDFIESLYYPKCPYQFNVVGVEMLGTIYERFLGSTIRLTPSHRAVVEDKPEVRKAGGVYYTPKYIVDYIVENTVGELLKKCKTPAAVVKLKILDPACGSGSFLLGAFQRLIDWHEDYFNANPEKITKGPAAECWWDAEAGRWRLTAKFKGRILVNNLFGVDIDPQACEVTTMSLYLKILEDVNAQFLMKTALLPQLDSNIKCGNSLIGSDYWEGGRTLMSVPPDEEERRRVNPFDWDVEFEEIMKAGGFDAVIGNPPYGGLLGENEVGYFKDNYYFTGNLRDTYFVFFEKGFNLLKGKGLIGMIIPNTWALVFSASNFRHLLTNETEIRDIVHFEEKVFSQATVDCDIIIAKKNKPKENRVRVTYFAKKPRGENLVRQEFWARTGGDIISLYTSEDDFRVLEKLALTSVPLRDLCLVKNGIKPFEVGKGKPPQTRETVKNKPYVSERKEGKEYVPLLRGSLINRYVNYWDGDYWVKYGPWLAAPRDPNLFFKVLEKIVMRQTGDSLIGIIVDNSYVCRNNLHMVITREGFEYSLKFLLGIINSKLMNYYYSKINPEKGEALAEVKAAHLERLLIKRINFDLSTDVARHDKMVALVEEMLALHKRLAAAKSDTDKKRTQRAVDATDRKIDTLVYELYGLTDEEIRIVEGSLRP